MSNPFENRAGTTTYDIQRLVREAGGSWLAYEYERRDAEELEQAEAEAEARLTKIRRDRSQAVEKLGLIVWRDICSHCGETKAAEAWEEVMK